MKRKSSVYLLSVALLLSACGLSTKSSSSALPSLPIESSVPASSSEAPAPSSSTVPSKTALSGQGTEENPYLLEEAGDFALMSALLSSDANALKANFALKNDINLSGVTIAQLASTTPFAGTFDGRGHAIKNLTVPYKSVTTSNGKVVYCGLFGSLENAVIKDLTIDSPTLDLDTDRYMYSGGALFGQAASSLVYMVEVKNADLKTKTTCAESDLPSYASTFGGIGGSFTASGNAIYSFSSLSFSGSVSADNPMCIVGGLIGWVTTNGQGSLNINNSYVDATSIKGGAYVGGLLGYSDYFTTATSVYVKANEVSTNVTTGYAGGVIGFSNWETFVKDAIVDVRSIKGGNSVEGGIKGSAGYVYGQGYGDYFEGIYSDFGSDSTNVYAVSGTLEGKIQNEIGHFNEVTTLPNDALTKVGLSSGYWEAKQGAYPALSKNPTLGNRTVTADANGGVSPTNDTLTIGAQDLGLDPLHNISNPTRQDYFFSNYYYDAEANIHYRAYVPTFTNTTIYADWTPSSMLEGTYEATVTFGDTLVDTAKPGSITIGNDASFVWTHFDGAQAIGKIDIYGDYFVLDLTSGDTGYDGVVASFQEGAFQFPDAYDYSSYTYNWVRKAEEEESPYSGSWKGNNGYSLVFKDNGVVTINDGDNDFDLSYTVDEDGKINITGSWNYGSFEIESCSVNADGQIILEVCQDYEFYFTLTFTSENAPKDYSNTGIVGDWYSNTHNMRRFAFGAEGTFVLYSIYSGFEDGSGSFTLEGNNLHLYAMGSFAESDLTYDETNKVIYGFLGNTDTVEVMTQHRYLSTFTGEDVAIYHFDGQDVIFIAGAYSPNSTLSGNLADGEEIVITTGSESKTYTVSGTTLTLKDDGGNTGGGQEEVKSIVGTWSGKVGMSTATVIINADGTGSYNGTAVTWTINGNTATASISGYIELTAVWNESKDTINFTYEEPDEFIESSGTLSRVA